MWRRKRMLSQSPVFVAHHHMKRFLLFHFCLSIHLSLKECVNMSWGYIINKSFSRSKWSMHCVIVMHIRRKGRKRYWLLNFMNAVLKSNLFSQLLLRFASGRFGRFEEKYSLPQNVDTSKIKVCPFSEKCWLFVDFITRRHMIVEYFKSSFQRKLRSQTLVLTIVCP